VKLASGVTSASSTPSLSTMIAFTLFAKSDISFRFWLNSLQRNKLNQKKAKNLL
jgi:hypothetical protein